MRDMQYKTLAAFFCVVGGPVAHAQQPLYLVPQPREARADRGVVLTKGLDIQIPKDSEDAFAARDVRESLRTTGVALVSAASASAKVVLLRASAPAAKALITREKLAFDAAMHDEGYLIVPDGTTLTVIGETAEGVFYGAQTVKQLIIGRGATAVLRMATVRDWPAMRHRGLHDDLSRGPVPTLDYMKRQMRTFATYKMNVYSPYFEHTLAYRANPMMGPPGGTLSREDIEVWGK